MRSEICSLFACVVMVLTSTVGAQDIVIDSFAGNGELTFNEMSSAQVYRVEWRTNWFSGQWSTGAPGVNAISPSGTGTVSCTVDTSGPSCFLYLYNYLMSHF